MHAHTHIYANDGFKNFFRVVTKENSQPQYFS